MCRPGRETSQLYPKNDLVQLLTGIAGNGKYGAEIHLEHFLPIIVWKLFHRMPALYAT